MSLILHWSHSVGKTTDSVSETEIGRKNLLSVKEETNDLIQKLWNYLNPRTAKLFQLTFAAKEGGLLQPPPLDFGLPDRISSWNFSWV